MAAPVAPLPMKNPGDLHAKTVSNAIIRARPNPLMLKPAVGPLIIAGANRRVLRLFVVILGSA